MPKKPQAARVERTAHSGDVGLLEATWRRQSAHWPGLQMQMQSSGARNRTSKGIAFRCSCAASEPQHPPRPVRNAPSQDGIGANYSGCRMTPFSPFSPSRPVATVLRAALVYFAFVLGTGFVLGVFRVPILVPRIGERWAELAEMPIMATVIYLAAGYVLRHFPEICTPARSLAAGFLALTLSVAAELGLAVVLQSQTLAEFISSRDQVSGSVYVALLVVFALMPRLRLYKHE